jgi:hypothetical protein
MDGATEAQIGIASDVANIARSLALEGAHDESATYMVRSVAEDDRKVLQLAHGMLLPLASAQPPAPGATEALRLVAAARRELGD